MKIEVPGEGPHTAKICFIGEAPGIEEKAKGRPFIGSAGKKLNNLLMGAGIMREECYITNVIKERPQQNDIKQFIDIGGERVKHETEEYLEYERILYKELAQLNCNIIVPLGATALYAVGRKFSIMKWRGSILNSSTETGSKKMVPVIHPAAALRNAIFSYHIRRDLERVREESKSPELNPPKRNLIIEPTLDEALSFLKSLSEITSFDIEVSGYELSCLCFTQSPDVCMSIPFRGSLGNYWHPEQEIKLMRAVTEVLENPNITKIIHNASFDTAFMYEKYGIQTVNFEDTMVAHGMLWPQFPKSLAFCTSMFTREPFYKDEGKDSKAGLASNFNQFWLYNAKDGAVTHEVWLELKKRLLSYGIWDSYKLQCNTIPSLNYFQVRGLRLDQKATGEMFEKLTLEINQHLVELQIEIDITRKKYNLNPLILPATFAGSSKQKANYFYKDLGISEIRTKFNRITTDGDALRKINKLGFKEAGILLKIAKKTKLKSSYIGVEVDEDARLRGSWNPVGAIGGRFSVSKLWRGTFYGVKKYVGMNMQTLPNDFKKYVLADEGCYLIDIDLAQAENRIVAWVGNVPLLKKAFNEKLDVHAMTAARIFNIPADEISDEPGSSQYSDGSKSQRFWGKQCNHAFNYGLGPRQFAKKFDLTNAEGTRIRDIYFRTYPEVESRYQAAIRTQISHDRVLTNPYGRKCTFLGFINDDLFRAGFAFIPQSTVADKINSSATIPIVQSREFDALECLLQVHDSVLIQASFDTPMEDVMNQLYKIKAALEEPIPFDEPFVIPSEFKVGLNYKEMIKFNIRDLELELETLKGAPIL